MHLISAPILGLTLQLRKLIKLCSLVFRCKAWLDSLCVCVCVCARARSHAHVQALCAMCSWAVSSFCIRLQAPGQSVRACLCDKSLQSCPTLCDPIGCGPPGSSIRGILQARILEWIAIAFSRIFPTQGSNLRLLRCLLHWQAGSLPLVPTGKPPGWSDVCLLCAPLHACPWM